MSDDQSYLDADVNALIDGLTAIEDEVAQLKAQPQAEKLDFSALDAVVARIKGDVPAPVATDPTTPSDPTTTAPTDDTTPTDSGVTAPAPNDPDSTTVAPDGTGVA